MEDTKKISSRVLINPELRTDSLRTANPFRSTVLQIDQGLNGRMVGNPEVGHKRASGKLKLVDAILPAGGVLRGKDQPSSNEIFR